MQCAKCGADRTDGCKSESCPNCGAIYDKITLSCPACKHKSVGREITAPNICPRCGTNVVEIQRQITREIRIEYDNREKRFRRFASYLGLLFSGLSIILIFVGGWMANIGAAMLIVLVIGWLASTSYFLRKDDERRREQDTYQKAQAEREKTEYELRARMQREAEVEKYILAKQTLHSAVRCQIGFDFEKHGTELAKQRRFKIRKLAYGVVDDSEWKREKRFFLEHASSLRSDLYAPDDEIWEIASSHIDTLIDRHESLSSSINSDIEHLDPIEFEHWCADIMRVHGWDARVTQASGDQGIDVVASRNNATVVIQCKKYSQPVGNAAVQEVIAGKAFEGARLGVVVSNQPFTKSAKQLAATVEGILLLHHTELPKFAEVTHDELI